MQLINGYKYGQFPDRTLAVILNQVDISRHNLTPPLFSIADQCFSLAVKRTTEQRVDKTVSCIYRDFSDANIPTNTSPARCLKMRTCSVYLKAYTRVQTNDRYRHFYTSEQQFWFVYYINNVWANTIHKSNNVPILQLFPQQASVQYCLSLCV